MNKVVSFLEDNALIADDQIQRKLAKLRERGIHDLRDKFETAIGGLPSESDSSPFTFLASSSFRGDRCCSSPECRLGAIDKVARFAALYSDRLYFPLAIGHKDDEPEMLEGGLRVAAALRPLIEHELIVPIRTVPRLCTECAKEFSPVAAQAFSNVDQLVCKYIKDFNVSAGYELFPDGAVSFDIEIQGPEDIIGLPKMHYVRDDIPDWAKHLMSGERMTLSSSDRELVRIVSSILRQSANDFMLQSMTATTLGTTYLTDRRGEAEFFAVSSADRDRFLLRTQALSKIAHNLPMFEDLSIEEILTLRRRETEAFQNYRNAVSSAIIQSSAENIDVGLFGDIYNDSIRPLVDALEAKDIAEKKKRRANLASRACLGSFAAVIGALVSGIHPALGASIAAGMTCIDKSACEDFTGSLRSSAEVKSDSSYFLLTLRRMIRRKQK
jgi:hypothetical protein